MSSDRETAKKLSDRIGINLTDEDIDRIISEITSDSNESYKIEGAVPESRSSNHDEELALLENYLAGNTLSETQLIGLETIIRPKERPAIDIINGKFTVNHSEWLSYSENPVFKSNIAKTIAGTGRLQVPGSEPGTFSGTGFFVGPNLVATNRHVANDFAEGRGINGLQFRAGLTQEMDLLGETEGGESRLVSVKSVQMIHPYWDFALLEVDADYMEFLPLSIEHAANLENRNIACVGYPTLDVESRVSVAVQRETFGNRFGVKRLLPGKLLGRKEVEDTHGRFVSAVRHDASTMGGASGSPLIDVESGLIVGIHFGHLSNKFNFAVPSFELARDKFVVDAGVKFETDVPPIENPSLWQEFWDAADPTVPA